MVAQWRRRRHWLIVEQNQRDKPEMDRQTLDRDTVKNIVFSHILNARYYLTEGSVQAKRIKIQTPQFAELEVKSDFSSSSFFFNPTTTSPWATNDNTNLPLSLSPFPEGVLNYHCSRRRRRRR